MSCCHTSVKKDRKEKIRELAKTKRKKLIEKKEEIKTQQLIENEIKDKDNCCTTDEKINPAINTTENENPNKEKTIYSNRNYEKPKENISRQQKLYIENFLNNN